MHLLILRINGSGEGIRGISRNIVQHAHRILVRVDVHGDDGSEDLLSEDIFLRRVDLDDRRLHEIALAEFDKRVPN